MCLDALHGRDKHSTQKKGPSNWYEMQYLQTALVPFHCLSGRTKSMPCRMDNFYSLTQFILRHFHGKCLTTTKSTTVTEAQAQALSQSDFLLLDTTLDITYGKHSLRYVGPKLWGKLSTADRSATTLQAFTNRIRKRDITRLMDNSCKGCILCYT